jgi:hypothetical protein
MGLDSYWQQGTIFADQVWVWLQYEASLHPVLFLGMVIVIVSAWLLFKLEVRVK